MTETEKTVVPEKPKKAYVMEANKLSLTPEEIEHIATLTPKEKKAFLKPIRKQIRK